MQNDYYVGAALGVKVLTDHRFSQIMAVLIQSLVVSISGIYGAMFVFRKSVALEIGGFPENRLVAEDLAFAIAMQKHARLQGKKFGILKSVQVSTLERKKISLLAVPKLTLQILKAFAGCKQTPQDLKYWYEPER